LGIYKTTFLQHSPFNQSYPQGENQHSRPEKMKMDKSWKRFQLLCWNATLFR